MELHDASPIKVRYRTERERRSRYCLPGAAAPIQSALEKHMKSHFCKSVLTPFLALGLVATAFATPAVAQDLGVSISIGQPGFYGQIDIGDAPRPRILYREPRIIEHVEYRSEPIYLRVRPTRFPRAG